MAKPNQPPAAPEQGEPANTVADTNGRLQEALSGKPNGDYTTVHGTLGERRAEADHTANDEAARLGQEMFGDTRMGRKFEAD